LFWVFLLLGIAILVVSVFIALSQAAFRMVLEFIFDEKITGIAACTDDQVDGVHALARSFFGEGVTEPTKIRQIRAKYRDGLQVALGRDRDGATVVRGYFFMFPINKQCCERIQSYNFTIADLTANDIAKQPSAGHAMYIGAIAARGAVAQMQLLGAMKSRASTVAQTRSRTAYARAATQRGLEVLLEHGFEPVHPKADTVDCFFKKTFERSEQMTLDMAARSANRKQRRAARAQEAHQIN